MAPPDDEADWAERVLSHRAPEVAEYFVSSTIFAAAVAALQNQINDLAARLDIQEWIAAADASQAAPGGSPAPIGEAPAAE
jgi:hypothetical protein